MIAGGVDVMSAAPYYTHDGRWGIKGPGLQLHDSLARGRVTAGGVHHPVPGGMIETAENLRREYGISRADQDALALRSRHGAARAAAEGRYEAETAPVTVLQGRDRRLGRRAPPPRHHRRATRRPPPGRR
ncbi:hypothetical protein SMICM304S_12189 [Streptomyces microflavus]